MFKKALSLLLSLMLIVTSLSVTVLSVSAASEGSTFVVAGTESLMGANWEGNPDKVPNNVMTAKDNGTYELVIHNVQASTDTLEVKVVENTTDGQQNWYGVDGGEFNVAFNVTSQCDVTVTFNPSTNAVTVAGDGVELITDVEINKVIAAGNGKGNGNWLNGIDWDPNSDDNLMKEVSEDVYEITYTDLEEYENYQVKFAANGAWADSWGIQPGENDSKVYPGSGVTFDGKYNGSDIIVEVPYALADVTLRLDLTEFNYASRSGAKITITVTDKSQEETTAEPDTTAEVTEETTEEPETTAEPDTTESTTTVTGEDKLTVTATSNYFPETKTEYNADTKEVKVKYTFKSSKNLLDTQWYIYFDPDVLKLSSKNTPTTVSPAIPMGGYLNLSLDGVIKYNASNISLYDFSSEEKVFAEVIFDVADITGKGPVETEVNLSVDVLRVSKIDPKTFYSDKNEEVILVNQCVVNDSDEAKAVEVSRNTTLSSSDDPETTVPETTVPETTVPGTTVPETTVPETTVPETTVPETTVPSGDSVYVVAGSESLLGVNWNGNPAEAPANVMTKKDDGTYELVISNVPVSTSPLEVKVVENTADGTQNWYGIDGGDFNVAFNVISPCDVTVMYDPSTNAVTVKGDGVKLIDSIQVDKMIAVGNGDGNWLNDAAWDPNSDANLMTEVADDVYEITYTDIEEFDNYQVKFAANGNWTDSWGYGENSATTEYPGSGVTFDANYNGGNIIVVVPYKLADVTLRLDLTEFDYASKERSGAKITITVTDKSQEETTTSEDDNLLITATSNYFPQAQYTYSKGSETDQVKVVYYFQSEKQLLNAQWCLTYDPSKLELVSVDMPNSSEGSLIKSDVIGDVDGSCSNLNLYDFSTSKEFVVATFKATGSGQTVVDLIVNDLTVSELDPATGSADETKDEALVLNKVIMETTTATARNTEIMLAGEPATTVPETTVPETTVPETTVPETTVPETTVPETTVEPETTIPEITVEPETTVPAPSQDATSATDTTVNGGSTSDVAPAPGTSGGTGAVQTGSASMAVIILLVLVSATGALFFARKRVR